LSQDGEDGRTDAQEYEGEFLYERTPESAERRNPSKGIPVQDQQYDRETDRHGLAHQGKGEKAKRKKIVSRKRK
jgi:hypothetical protein